jgi:outer membrane protein
MGISMHTMFKALAAAATVLAFANTASALDLGDKFVVSFGVAGVLPDEEAAIRPIGGTVDISDEYVPSVNLEWFFTDNVSAELICCIAPHNVKAVGTAAGTVDLGEITLFPPTVTLKYHFAPDAPFQPYVGAGVNFTTFFNEELPAGPVRSIDYDNTFGGAIQVGADIPVTDKWGIRLDVKKIWIEPDVNLNTALGPVSAAVKINPIVAFVGASYRF